MFCLNCGHEMKEDASFCPVCGVAVGKIQPSKKKRRQKEKAVKVKTKKSWSKGRKALVIILLILALLVAGTTVLLTQPKVVVARAAVKTAAAYTDAALNVMDTTVLDILKGKKYSYSLDLDLLNGGSELAAWEGCGIHTLSNVNWEEHRINTTAAMSSDDSDLLTLSVMFEENGVYFNIPEIMDDLYFGMDTTTLGEDLDSMGYDIGEYKRLSFELFDLLEKVDTLARNCSFDEKGKQALVDASLELLAALDVTGGDKQTVRVNGNALACKEYTLCLKQEAMESYFAEVEDIFADQDVEDKLEAGIEDILDSVLLPRDVKDELMSKLDFSEVWNRKEAFRDLEETIEEIGDQELVLYVRHGYIMAALWEQEIDDIDHEIGIYLGGGNRYVDDLSIEWAMNNGNVVTLTSSGNHGARGGAFIDETVVEFDDGEDVYEYTSEFMYDPQKDANNLSFTWQMDDMLYLTGEGSVAIEEEQVSICLDELSVEEDGDTVFSVGLACSIGQCQEAPEREEVTMLKDISEDDWDERTDEFGDNINEWIDRVNEECPVLYYKLFGYWDFW